MKKTLILISIFMIMLISCSGKKFAVNAAANKTVGLPNPVQGSTVEDIAKELNVKFAVPDDAKNIRYSIIAGKLAQMDFIWNEAECTARIERDAEWGECRNRKMADNRSRRSCWNLLMAE